MGGLTLGGQGGEIRIGRKVQATLASFSKSQPRKTPTGQKIATIKFEVTALNQYWVNYGPPQTVALPAPKRWLVYEVESGDIRAGALIVKLPPRVERR
jgi:hypothetical protein